VLSYAVPNCSHTGQVVSHTTLGCARSRHLLFRQVYEKLIVRLVHVWAAQTRLHVVKCDLESPSKRIGVDVELTHFAYRVAS
jgi:hypothetical protein